MFHIFNFKSMKSEKMKIREQHLETMRFHSIVLNNKLIFSKDFSVVKQIDLNKIFPNENTEDNKKFSFSQFLRQKMKEKRHNDLGDFSRVSVNIVKIILSFCDVQVDFFYFIFLFF